MRRAILIACAFVLVAIAVPSTLSQGNAASSGAVPQTAGATAKPLEFDVVSIRPSPPDSPGGGTGIFRTGYTAPNQPLYVTIMYAYFSNAFQYWNKNLLVGAPAWVLNERYDINAKISPDDMEAWNKQRIPLASAEMLHTMLQATLAERCKLKIHKIATETPVYMLVVGKHTPKLKERRPDDPIPSGGSPFLDGGTTVYENSGQTIRFVTALR